MPSTKPKTADQPGEVFNLDALEQEAPKTPLMVVLGGRRFLLRDAETIDYRDLVGAYQRAEFGDIKPLVTLLVPPGDRDDFEALELPMFKVNRLIERYQKHYGLPDQPGKSFGSRTS